MGSVLKSHFRVRAGASLFAIACTFAVAARAEGPAAAPAAAPAAPATTPPAAPAGAEAQPEPAADFYPTAGMSLNGAVGFGRIESAESGRPGSLRVGLDMSYFQRWAFPTTPSFDRSIVGELAAGYTWMKGFDSYLAVHNSSNYNNTNTPRLVQSLGDVIVGTKWGHDFGPTTLAGDLRVDLKSGLGNDYLKIGDSTIAMRLLSTTPFAIGQNKLILTANVGWIFSRSTDAVNAEITPGLLYGTGYSAYNQLIAGVALMYDLGRFKPFASFDLDLPTGVSGHALAPWHTTEFGAATKRGGAGLRVNISPSAGDLDVLVEGAGGVGAIGFARTEPWMVTAAYSFAFDASLYVPPPPPVKITAPPPPTTGDLRGTVVDMAGAPVKGAVINIDGIAPVATDASGVFVAHGIKAGAITARVEREGFKPGTFTANITVGSEASTQARVEALPPPPPPAPVAPPPPPPPPPAGYVAGQIRSGLGGVQGTVRINGPQVTEARTDTDGMFSIKLAPGRYELTLLPDTYLARAAVVTIYADKASAVVVNTAPKPAVPAVTRDGDKLTLTKPFSLDEKRAEPSPADLQILSEVADVLARDPSKKLVINVHSDKRRGDKGDRVAWTEARANALRNALIEQGVPSDRVQAFGLGTTQPLVPFASRGASKNRRVELSLEPMPAHKVVPIKPAGQAAPAGDDFGGVPPL